MLTTAFNFNLKNQVQKGKALISMIDGQNPSLVCVTVGGKVFIYTPNPSELNQDQNTEFLNLNKDIQSVQAAKFAYNYPQESLVLGSENILMLYDIETNSERFYKEISDGISCVAFGTMYGFKDGIIMVGGNCSLFGFNEDGDEIYWNVVSDTVSALCFTDIDQDQENELVVGSEDNIIRVFKNEEILYEINEAAIPICLAKMNKSRFAFGLDNGMVGVYSKKKKVWRAKSQMKPVGIVHAKFETNQGYRPLIVARSNGQIEVRHDNTGENLYKMQINEPISMLLKEDFRQDKTQQIIAITKSGSVKGYIINQDAVGKGGTQKLELHEQIQELQKKKQNLLVKYQSLQEAINNKNPNLLEDNNQILPADTKIAHTFKHNSQKQIVNLIIQSTKNTFLKSVILFSDKLFEGETFFYSPATVTNTVYVPIKATTNINEIIRAKVMVGTSSHSSYFQIFEFETQLPRFCNYRQIETDQIQIPQSKLKFKIFERIPRYIKWIEQSFIIDDEYIQKLDQNSGKTVQNNHLINVSFINIVNQQVLNIQADSQEGQCIIYTDSIELAGDIVQDLSQYMNLNELESFGSFPKEMQEFKGVLEQIQEYKSSKMHITADIAHSVNEVKTLIVKAEDARMMDDMQYMRKYYTEVMGENRSLVMELTKRKQNNDILMEGIRAMNSMINKGSNLRVGSYKQKVTNLCRAAIKSKNLHQLAHIIENGMEY